MDFLPRVALKPDNKTDDSILLLSIFNQLSCELFTMDEYLRDNSILLPFATSLFLSPPSPSLYVNLDAVLTFRIETLATPLYGTYWWLIFNLASPSICFFHSEASRYATTINDFDKLFHEINFPVFLNLFRLRKTKIPFFSLKLASFTTYPSFLSAFWRRKRRAIESASIPL